MKVMDNIFCFIFHPQPPNGGLRSEHTENWCAAGVPFGACPDFSRGFRGKKSFTLIFCLLIGLATFGQNEIDFQNKRLLNSLKKNGIGEFSKLEEIKYNSEELYKTYGKFFRVTDNQVNSEVEYVFIGRVNSCRAGGCCDAVLFSGNAESEYFDYFIFFDSSKTVKLVEVYNYAATHGYEITAKGWLKQFVGFSGKDTLEVNKDIDGISGATVSVFAITGDVQQKTRLLKGMN